MIQSIGNDAMIDRDEMMRTLTALAKSEMVINTARMVKEYRWAIAGTFLDVGYLLRAALVPIKAPVESHLMARKFALRVSTYCQNLLMQSVEVKESRVKINTDRFGDVKSAGRGIFATRDLKKGVPLYSVLHEGVNLKVPIDVIALISRLYRFVYRVYRTYIDVIARMYRYMCRYIAYISRVCHTLHMSCGCVCRFTTTTSPKQKDRQTCGVSVLLPHRLSAPPQGR